MIYKRNLREKLEKALKRSPVTLLLGARQTGKTTLMREIAKNKDYHYVSLDDVRYLLAAQRDPMGFIQDIPKPVIIDEIQRVPELLLAIKHDVDKKRIPGQYALTGSANPLLLPKVSDSLAGRIEILTLYPLSQGELIGHKEIFIDAMWSDHNPLTLKCLPLTRPELQKRMLTGGYPLVQTMDEEERYSWFNNYITTIIQKDIVDLAVIEGIQAMPRLLSVLASHAGSLLNVSEISRQVGIPHSTLERYLSLLKTIFIIFFQETWHTNLIRRIIKSPKAYVIDSGLLSWLLLLNEQNIIQSSNAMGSLLENFVMTELVKQATWNNVPVRFYHFRTSSGEEVDIIMERMDGKIIAIEVKASATPTHKDIKGLLRLKEQIGDKWHRGILLHTGDVSVPLDEGISALPISSLWSF